MKKVLFVMKYPIEEQYSIKNKLDGEMNAVSNLGYEVYYISFDHKNLYLNHGETREIVQPLTLGNSKLYYHLISFYDIYRVANKSHQKYNFDLIYFRYGPLNAEGIKFFKEASKSATMVVEIPTFPIEKEKQKNVLRRLYMRGSYEKWKSAKECITLYTIIGDQAEEYNGVPALNINNGVNVNALTPKNGVKQSDGKIHLLAVAAMCNWQGYDRIIRGLAEWNNPRAKEYVIDLVGDEGDGSLENWIRLSKELGIENQVVAHGRLTGEPLTQMFEIATIGLGTFGLYRKGMSSGSILKVREYMARGLPFVFAHEDPNISEGMPWCIKVPNDDSVIDMNKIDSFINALGDYRELSKKMRQYAISNMTWEAQFEKIINKIELLTGNKF